ncbi:MAG: DegT/DnrJ/EryC1/StrS family aminotransferase [Brevinema sp.]
MIPFIDLKAQYQAYKKDIDARIAGVLERCDFIQGKDLKEMEAFMSDYTGVHCVSVASGTDALLIPLLLKNIKPGDEIITTPFSFFATAEVIAILGAKPVFVDINPNTCTIDPSLIEAAITPKTKGIISVSLYGQCADLDAVETIAKKHNLFHLEDAAQSLGAFYKDRKSCAIAEMAGTSLYPAKSLGCYGDAGLMFFKDADMAAEARIYMNHGQTATYNHKYVSINGRMDTIQAAVIMAKMPHYDKELSIRQEVADYYNSRLEGSAATVVERASYTSRHVWAQYSLKVQNRQAFQDFLKEKGVPTAVHYPRGMHLQPALAYLGYKEGAFPITEKISQEIVSLPMHAFMSVDTQKIIMDHVTEALERTQ